MRRVLNSCVRGFVAVTVILVLSASVSAAPRGRDQAPKEKVPPISKILKNIIRALGDGLTVPLP